MLNRRVWTSQPQIAVRVDWGNPLTRGLAFCAVYSEPIRRDVVTNERATNFGTNSVKTVVTSAGIGITGDQSSDYAIGWSPLVVTSDGAGTGDFTFLSLSAPISESTVFCLIGQSVAGTAPQGFLFANTANNYSGSAGRITFGSASGLLQTGTTAVDGRFHVFVGSRTGTTNTIDVDGIEAATGTLTAGDIHASTARLTIAGLPGYTGWKGASAHPQVMNAAWNRGLSRAERVAIGHNPWQLFAPLSRPVFVPSAAAAGIYTLSSATYAPGSITATGVTPRVSVAVT